MDAAVTFTPDDLEVSPAELEAALAAAGRSASALARALCVDVGTVSRWRRGAMKLSRSRMVGVLAALGLPLTWRPPNDAAARPAPRGRPRVKHPRR